VSGRGITAWAAKWPHLASARSASIFFASSPDPAERFELRFLSFSSTRTELIARIEGELGNGMSLSPDGRTLLSCVEQRTGDLVMVENFQ